MNSYVNYGLFNLITWSRDEGWEFKSFHGKARNVIFLESPDSLYDEKVLAECERNSMSFQDIHICLPIQTFY